MVAATELDPQAEVWAQQGINALLALKQAAAAAVAGGRTRIGPRILAKHIGRFRDAALVGIKDHSGQKTTVGKKLHERTARLARPVPA